MARTTRRVTKTTSPNGDVTETTREVSTPTTNTTRTGQNMATNIIWVLATILIVLLGFRFVLALLGANPSNWFANFIYTTSHPFVAPFFSLFSYNYHYGVSRFEIYTLVAIVVYWVIARLLTMLISLDRRSV